MNLLWATLVYLFFAAIIGVGTVMLMLGKPALFIGGLVVYMLLFSKVGCASH